LGRSLLARLWRKKRAISFSPLSEDREAHPSSPL
jgi:hypothetical protein